MCPLAVSFEITPTKGVIHVSLWAATWQVHNKILFGWTAYNELIWGQNEPAHNDDLYSDYSVPVCECGSLPELMDFKQSGFRPVSTSFGKLKPAAVRK